MTYCMVPVARLTDEMLAASTTPDLDAARVTPEGRIVLCYRGAAHPSAGRYVTREGSEAADEWLASRPEPADMAEWVAAVEAHRETLRGRG